MLRATNWANRGKFWQLCEQADDAEEKKMTEAWPQRCGMMLCEWMQTIELQHATRYNTICHCAVVNQLGQFVTRAALCAFRQNSIAKKLTYTGHFFF